MILPKSKEAEKILIIKKTPKKKINRKQRNIGKKFLLLKQFIMMEELSKKNNQNKKHNRLKQRNDHLSNFKH